MKMEQEIQALRNLVSQQEKEIAELKVQVPGRPVCNISELQKQVSSLELRVREQARDIRKIVMIINAKGN